MKYCLTFTFLSIYIFAGAQNKYDCRIIAALLLNEKAQKSFLLNEFPRMPIVIVDAEKSFINCTIGKIGSRHVEISQDSSLLSNSMLPYIIIHHIEKTRFGFKLVVEHKNSKGYGNVEIETENNTFVVSRFQVGHF